MKLSEEAKEARRKYQREYRRRHPEIRRKQQEYTRKWKKEHPERSQEYQRRYWEKKAAQALAEDEATKGEVNNGTKKIQ